MGIAVSSIPLSARDFTYTYEGKTITYTVISENAKTCETKEGNPYYCKNKVSGNLILPENPYNGNDEYRLVRIGDYAFNESDLTSVVIPNSVTSIGRWAFRFCSNLTSVVIPNSVTSIGEYAFLGSGLTSVVIPNSVTRIDTEPFWSCSLEKIRVSRPYSKDLFNNALSESGVIECLFCDVETIRSYNLHREIRAFDRKYYYSIQPLVKGCSVTQIELPDYDKDLACEVSDITAKVYSGKNMIAEMPLSTGIKTVFSGLSLDEEYTINIAGISSDNEFYPMWVDTFKTLLPEFKCKVTATQRTLTISDIEYSSDESFKISEVGIYYDSNYNKIPIKDKFNIKNLYPDTSYDYRPYLIYNDGSEYKFDRRKMITNGWDCYLSNSPSAPTSVMLTASFTEDDAIADNVWWEFDGQRVDGTTMPIVSLVPNSSYSATFHIGYGNKTYKFSRKFTTSEVEFETLVPKGVSSSCAIVAAKTNISDIEPMVGFEWKKYDAPATLTPSKGYGAICDGVLEGYIKNLQSSSYYNVRPFYQDANGEFYYGDWTSFDPSDFSYFEPTVRTYPVQEVTSSSATVRGYALSGTDNIKSQGFQYWRSGSNKVKSLVPASSEIITVAVNGQIMTATFENLEEGTTYTYRAYVETEAGFTYGEEQSFTTETVNGIDAISADEETPSIEGYYDMSGRRYSKPQYGFNIIVYSDGTVKKIILR